MNILSVIIPTYNKAAYLSETLQSVCSQVIPKEWVLEIIVVDDGSRDESARIASSFPDNRIRLIRRDQNGGRAIARNTGLEAAKGDYCLFIDADCSYTHCRMISDYIEIFDKGYRVCFGAVTAIGDDFWQRYQRDNHANFQQQNKPLEFVTTANFGVEKNVLLSIGGFDTGYNKYGFEDRDLYLSIKRYLRNNHIQFAANILAAHVDHIHLDQVCWKMFESGIWSSIIFKKKYPIEYKKMSYAKVDYSLLPETIQPFFHLLLKTLNFWRIIGNITIRSEWVPYRIKRYTVKVLSGLYYMDGTRVRAGI